MGQSIEVKHLRLHTMNPQSIAAPLSVLVAVTHMCTRDTGGKNTTISTKYFCKVKCSVCTYHISLLGEVKREHAIEFSTLHGWTDKIPVQEMEEEGPGENRAQKKPVWCSMKPPGSKKDQVWLESALRTLGPSAPSSWAFSQAFENERHKQIFSNQANIRAAMAPLGILLII